MRRLVSCLLSLPLIAVASTVPQASASPIQDVNPTPSASCPAVEVITAAGSGDAHLDDDPNFPRGFVVGTNFSKLAEERFEGVRSWQLPYYGSAGIVASNEKIGLPKFPNYAASAADGVEKVRARIDEVSAVCLKLRSRSWILSGCARGRRCADGSFPEQAEKVIAAPGDPRRAVRMAPPHHHQSRADPGASHRTAGIPPGGDLRPLRGQGSQHLQPRGPGM